MHSSLTHKVTFFKIAQKVAQYLGYFGKKICHHEISKIAQSGHTERGIIPSLSLAQDAAAKFRTSISQRKRHSKALWVVVVIVGGKRTSVLPMHLGQ